jgi:hypothetical protein
LVQHHYDDGTDETLSLYRVSRRPWSYVTLGDLRIRPLKLHQMVIGAAMAFALTPPLRAAEPASTPLALVIGNSAYMVLPRLGMCGASARIVSAALQHAGFQVTDGMDLSNGEMAGAITRFAARLAAAPGTNGVLYICGYAVDLEGRDFLLPVSARMERETDVLSQGIPAKSLLDAMGRSGTPVGLVLLDAVPMTKAATSLQLETLTQLPRQTVSFAGAADKAPVSDTPSPFATAIATALGSPPIEVGAMLQAIGAGFGGGPDALTLGPPARPAWLVGGQTIAVAPAIPPPAAPAATRAPVPEIEAAAPEEDQLSQRDRRRIQAALWRMGYYAGRINGHFRADTRAAILRYQEAIGADKLGTLTPEQSARLLTVTDTSVPRR